MFVPLSLPSFLPIPTGGRGAERRYIPAPYTPPYTSATPEVIHKALDSPEMQGAEFVVMATDGLWDSLSNQQVSD